MPSVSSFLKNTRTPSLKKTIVPSWNSSKSYAKKTIDTWKDTKTPTNLGTAIKPGKFVFTKYVAVTRGKYDINPCVMILRANKTHVFGININWLSRTEKQKLLKYMISRNVHEMSVQQIKLLFNTIRKKYKFTKNAYRLYHRKAFQGPRLYTLDVPDFYEALSRDILKVREVK